MTRQYVMKASRGPRGPYKTKSKKQWTPRRKLASSKEHSSILTHRLPIPTKYAHIATAITLAVNKLLLKPKRHTKKVPGRRLNFKIVPGSEIVKYMMQNRRACKLTPYQRLPSRPTIYRLMSSMGMNSASRTRTKQSYQRNFSELF